MKATEVRLGNWIYNERRSFIKVSSISVEVNGRCIAHIPENQCSPIPLTEELLLNAGFRNCGLGEFAHSAMGNWYLLKNFKREWIACINQITDVYVRYIHELQNFFLALTGEELEVKL